MTELRWLALITFVAAGCGGSDEVVPVDAPMAVDAEVVIDADVDARQIDAAVVDAPTDAPADAPTDARTDAGPMSVEVSHTSVVVVEPAGGHTVQVTLSSQPPGPVDVAIASADTAVATVTQSTLSFTTTDWATPQTFRIDSVSDPDVMHETTAVTCTPSLSGWAAATISVFVSDQTDPVLVSSTSQLTVAEGATMTFNVRISAMPAGPTNVTVTSADPDAVTVTPATFQILPADWNVDHPVTVMGVQDGDALDETVHVTIMSPGQSSRTVTVIVNDDD
jgi:hypothetical protein